MCMATGILSSGVGRYGGVRSAGDMSAVAEHEDHCVCSD
jgi:hypothetical protein